MIKTAREKGLVRVENLKPSGELSDILVMLDKNRSDLLKLKDDAYSRQNDMLQLRCLRDLAALEERRLNILRKVGLFLAYPVNAHDRYM
jgi:hypothetical protein